MEITKEDAVTIVAMLTVAEDEGQAPDYASLLERIRVAFPDVEIPEWL